MSLNIYDDEGFDVTGEIDSIDYNIGLFEAELNLGRMIPFMNDHAGDIVVILCDEAINYIRIDKDCAPLKILIDKIYDEEINREEEE